MKTKKLPPHIIQYQTDIKSGKLKLNFEWFQTDNCPAIWTIQATSSFLPMPIGIMWVECALKSGKGILNVYVVDDYRKCGIATQMLRRVWEWDKNIKIIYTNSGNNLSIPWLKKIGFVEDDVIGWKLTRKQWNKYPSK
jgi:GNAT superfamily N-acetyltransferase